MSDKVYARVVDGVIAEYPVMLIHIENRGHPMDWYTQVEYPDQPVVPDYYWLQESLAVVISLQGVIRVVATYTIVPFTLDQILNTLRAPGDIPGMPSNTPMAIADIPLATINRVSVLAADYAQGLLDAFANTKNYENIGSAASYKDSTFAAFGAEGAKAFQLRDATWIALYNYLGQVQTNAVAVPIMVSEIDAILPVLSWS